MRKRKEIWEDSIMCYTLKAEGEEAQGTCTRSGERKKKKEKKKGLHIIDMDKNKKLSLAFYSSHKK